MAVVFPRAVAAWWLPASCASNSGSRLGVPLPQCPEKTLGPSPWPLRGVGWVTHHSHFRAPLEAILGL